MIGVTTSRESAARRRWPASLAGLGIVALAATACGGAAATTAPAAASSKPSPSPTATQAAFPGVIGTAAAVSASSLEVQNPTSGQVTVTFTSTTPMTQTLPVTSAAVAVGRCVAVTSQAAAGATPAPAAGGTAASPVAAGTVTVSAAVKGKCTAAGGFGGFGGGFGGRGGGTFTPRPGVSARPRPSGARGGFGGFGGADGLVTSLSASGFVVQGRTRAGGSAASVTVTTTSATKYLSVVTARPSALKVGQCITAVGTANSIGAIAARSIRISSPGPSGCVTAFGRRGGFGSGAAGPGAGPGANA